MSVLTVIVDGTNALHKALHTGEKEGIPKRFLLLVRNVVMLLGADRVIVVFDTPGFRSPRRLQILPTYKSNRDSSPEKAESLANAQAEIVPLLRRLGCRVVSLASKEADDVIAYLATHCGTRAVVASDDTDFLQLISLGVNVYHPRSKIHMTALTVMDEYGVGPDKILLLKAIVGDAADCIDGPYMVGPVTAKKVIDGTVQLKESDNELVQRNLALMSLQDEPFTEAEIAALQRTIAREVSFDETCCFDLAKHGISAPLSWASPFERLT